MALRLPADAPFELVPLTAEQIRQRAPKVVTKPETLDYRTMLPEPGGLFDPKLFGPGTVIDAPLPAPDELIKPRKTQFARVALAIPMLHPLVVQHARDELAALIGKSTSDILAASHDVERARELIAALAPDHAWAVMHDVPVLPPDLRSLKQDEHDRWVMTPLNSWYQRIVTRNNRLAKQLEQNVSPAQLNADFCELQNAFAGLAENDEAPKPALDAEGMPQASLRGMCGGTNALYDATKELALEIDAPAGEAAPARHYIARAVLFAQGFEVKR